MSETIVSVFKTPRACLGCGEDFLPPKTPSRVIAQHCSTKCRQKVERRRLGGIGASIKADRRAPRIHEPGITTMRPPQRRQPRPSQPRRIGPRVTQPAADAPRFARNISLLRQQRGFTQATLAALIGVHANSINGWETGKVEPPVSKFAALAQALGVSLDVLWGDDAMEARAS